MRALFDIGPMVRKYSALPPERVQLIRDIADFQLAQVRRGIVIIFAAGSGQAVLALQRLTRFLAARDESDRPHCHRHRVHDDSGDEAVFWP